MGAIITLPSGHYRSGERDRVASVNRPAANTYPTFGVVDDGEKSPYFVIYDVAVIVPKDRDVAMSQLFSPSKIITGLVAIIATMASVGTILIGVIYGNIRTDLDDLKKSNLEMVKSVASIDKQVAVSNQRLDDILKELRRR